MQGNIFINRAKAHYGEYKVNNFWQMIKNLSPGRLISLAAILIFLISFFAYIIMQVNTVEYSVLYTDLELEDANQIVSRLEAANVKYKLNNNGTEILVPVDQVNRMRLDTAELALASKGSNVGYEIFDNTDALGSTNFVQNINLIRALEGELARTIRSVDNIKSARVHLVLPKREMFSREEQTPSASVVIKTKAGTLTLKEIQSIQKLVAAAVPKLDVKNVSIIDSSGKLLTDDSEDKQSVDNATNEIIRLDQERKLTKSVEDMMEKAVGMGKAKARVNLEMDFDQVVTNEEIYDPDSQVARSQQTVTESSVANEENNPVTVSQNIPNGDTITQSGNVVSQSTKSEETINYEISKTIRNKVKNDGEIKRITVAVMVDGVYETDEKGNKVYRPRTAEEMEKLRALVKSAVGYDANRGDMVDVENIRFASIQEETSKAPEILIMGFTKAELMRIAEGLGVAVVAILVIILVIRPLINNAFDNASPLSDNGRLLGENAEDDNLLLSNFLNEAESDIDDLVNLNKVDGRVKVSSLKKLNDIVEKNPETAVGIIRSWLYSNDGN